MDKYTRIIMLQGFYGPLLSRRQREVASLYYEDNLSLGEIAQEFGISRQGVHDALRSAEKALEQHEEELGLLARYRHQEELLAGAEGTLARLREGEEAGRLGPRERSRMLDELAKTLARLKEEG